MFIRDRIISESINKLRKEVGTFDKFIKKLEFKRGLYRYPDKMLGRNLEIDSNRPTDILVFAAHQDDDVLALGATLYRHSLNGDHIKVVFVTNGTAGSGESWFRRTKRAEKRANLRHEEAVNALLQINIPKENIYCLGFPDGGTQRYLKKIAIDISMILEKLNPRRVYVHSIEGGHIDHDMTSFVVKSVCEKRDYTNVYEYASYNPAQPIGTEKIRFFPTLSDNFEEIIVDITEAERNLKRKMLAYHQSQGVEKYYLQGEAIRKVNTNKSEVELYQHCQLSKRCLTPIVKEFNKSIFSIIAIYHFITSEIVLLAI